MNVTQCLKTQKENLNEGLVTNLGKNIQNNNLEISQHLFQTNYNERIEQ